MLKHEEDSEPARSAAGHASPEEVVTAIAAIERGHQTKANEAAPIGQILSEMGLSVTEAEVVDEVQAQRVRSKQRRAWRRMGQAGLIAGALAFSGLIVTLLGIGQPGAGDGANSQFFGETNASLGAKLLVQDRTSPTPILRTLAETPEGRTVFCSADAVDYAAMSRQYRVEPRPIVQPPEAMNWPVVKHNDELYLRGWTPAKFSRAAAKQDERIAVYNIPTAPGAGTHPIPITIRLMPEVFANGAAYQHWPITMPEVFYCAHLRLNNHAWEKW